MRKFATAVLAAALAAAPSAVAAQGIGVGAKIGTLGYGVDGALALSDMLTLRAGIAISPEELPFADMIPSDDIDGLDYTLLVPTTTLQAGVDLHILGPIKLLGGVVYRSENLRARADVSGSYEIGNSTYTETGTVTAELEQGSLIPYAGIGFGRLARTGFGIYVDLAIAYAGEADVVMSASDNLEQIPGFVSDLQVEADQFADDAGIIKNLYPVLQIGLRFGLGN